MCDPDVVDSLEESEKPNSPLVVADIIFVDDSSDSTHHLTSNRGREKDDVSMLSKRMVGRKKTPLLPDKRGDPVRVIRIYVPRNVEKFFELIPSEDFSYLYGILVHVR